ncbi:hypothetical protein PPACK8108_LOCUS1108, partial [Phakopsora pachyrhizi]
PPACLFPSHSFLIPLPIYILLWLAKASILASVGPAIIYLKPLPVSLLRQPCNYLLLSYSPQHRCLSQPVSTLLKPAPTVLPVLGISYVGRDSRWLLLPFAAPLARAYHNIV